MFLTLLKGVVEILLVLPEVFEILRLEVVVEILLVV